MADLRVVEEEVPLGEEDPPIVIAVSAVKVTLPPPSVSSDVASPNANNKLLHVQKTKMIAALARRMSQ